MRWKDKKQILQIVKENGSIRPIYQVSNCRNAGHKWEAVE